MRNSSKRVLALLLSLVMLFSFAVVPAFAENSESRIVTLGFENVAWHTEDGETYCSADITASVNTEDETFDAMLIQFNLVYNGVRDVLGLDAVIASDTVDTVTTGTGRNQKTSTMAIDSIDVDTADSLGYATVLMHGDNGVRHPIKNGQVIATAYFLLANESKRSTEARLSFDKGVINYIDDSNEIQNYSVVTSASATVPALEAIETTELGGITLNPTEITASSTEQTVRASVTDKDGNAVSSGIVWSLDRTDGVSINSSTGEITVTSTASGNYEVTVNPAEGATNVSGTARATLIVNSLPDEAQELNEVTLNPPEVTAANAEQTVQASVTDKDGNAVSSGIVWSLDRTDGVSINSGTGEITVTSTASGNYEVTVNPAEEATNVTGTARATLRVNPFSDEYTLEVSGGRIQNPSENGKYQPGNKVTLQATVSSFSNWTGLDDVTFESGNANSATITFYMPARNVKAVAHGGCYVATAVYGSYDCPEVWTLRRFRDKVLAKTWYGRLFIHLYYAVSPTAVKLFGQTQWFQNFFRNMLDPWVADLQADGFESTPYNDMSW